MNAATIVFTAHNRRDLVLEAIRLAKLQTVPVEIIVADDASTDGIGEALAREHPDVRFIRSDVSRGPCYQRNRGIAMAECDIVFPLDDDSLLVSPHTIAQTLREFTDDRVAAIAMPFQNILQSERVLQARGGGPRMATVNFAACAHAIRKGIFEAVGGYTEDYFYMGEEGDLALRLMDRGYLVELGTADPIHHMQPPRRRSYRPDFYGRRNDLLFYYLRCPARYLPARYAGTIAKGLLFGARNECMKATLDGLAAGIRASFSRATTRTPVSLRTFRTFLACKYRGHVPMAELDAMLAT